MAYFNLKQAFDNNNEKLKVSTFKITSDPNLPGIASLDVSGNALFQNDLTVGGTLTVNNLVYEDVQIVTSTDNATTYDGSTGALRVLGGTSNAKDILCGGNIKTDNGYVRTQSVLIPDPDPLGTSETDIHGDNLNNLYIDSNANTTNSLVIANKSSHGTITLNQGEFTITTTNNKTIFNDALRCNNTLDATQQGASVVLDGGLYVAKSIWSVGGITFPTLSFSGGGTINGISNDPFLAGNSQTKTVTEFACKSYVDTHATTLTVNNPLYYELDNSLSIYSAGPLQSGTMSTTPQSFAGEKTFNALAHFANGTTGVNNIDNSTNQTNIKSTYALGANYFNFYASAVGQDKYINLYGLGDDTSLNGENIRIGYDNANTRFDISTVNKGTGIKRKINISDVDTLTSTAVVSSALVSTHNLRLTCNDPILISNIYTENTTGKLFMGSLASSTNMTDAAINITNGNLSITNTINNLTLLYDALHFVTMRTSNLGNLEITPDSGNGSVSVLGNFYANNTPTYNSNFTVRGLVYSPTTSSIASGSQFKIDITDTTIPKLNIVSSSNVNYYTQVSYDTPNSAGIIYTTAANGMEIWGNSQKVMSANSDVSGNKITLFNGADTALLSLSSLGILTLQSPLAGYVRTPSQIVQFNDTDSTSHITGAIVSTGGIAAAKNIYCGQNLYFDGAVIPLKEVQLLATALLTGPDSPTISTLGNMAFVRFSNLANNYVFCSLDLPHDYQLGSSLSLHIHFFNADTGTGYTRWNIRYNITAPGSNFNMTGTDLGNVDVNNNTSNTYYHFQTTLGTIVNPPIVTDGYIINFRMGRLASADTYAGYSYMCSFALHYYSNRYGSV